MMKISFVFLLAIAAIVAKTEAKLGVRNLGKDEHSLHVANILGRKDETGLTASRNTHRQLLWFRDLNLGERLVNAAIFIWNGPDDTTAEPTSSPSASPSASPSSKPSASPSGQPSASPSGQPSTSPSSKPSVSPTSQPSTSPSSKPSVSPTSPPSVGSGTIEATDSDNNNNNNAPSDSASTSGTSIAQQREPDRVEELSKPSVNDSTRGGAAAGEGTLENTRGGAAKGEGTRNIRRKVLRGLKKVSSSKATRVRTIKRGFF